MKNFLEIFSLTFDRISAVLCGTGALISTLGVFWLIGSTGVHVLMRALNQGGISGVIELNSLAMIIVVFFALGQAQRQGVHVSVTLGVRRFPPALARYCRILALCVSVVVVLWWLFATITKFGSSFSVGERLTGVTDLVVWPARLAIVIGFGILFWEILNQIIQKLKGKLPLADQEESLGN